DIVAERGGDARGLTTHLPARRAKLRHGFHRVQARVERGPRRNVAAGSEPRGNGHGDGVAWPGRRLEMRGHERLEVRSITHAPLLRVRFETERMREATGGEHAIGELQQREERVERGHQWSWRWPPPSGRNTDCTRSNGTSSRPSNCTIAVSSGRSRRPPSSASVKCRLPTSHAMRSASSRERGVTASTGSGAASMTTYQSGATCKMSPRV